MSIISAISGWKKKLLDLTRRNRLLHFRPSKTSTLTVSSPSIDEIFTRLVIEERPWAVWEPEEPEEAEVDENQQSLFEPNGAPEPDEKPLSLKEQLKKYPPTSSEIVLLPGSNSTSLSKILSTIYRRARSDYQEKGVRTLYLGLGLLRWREPGAPTSEEAVRSPIILVPVELRRETANDPFILNFSGDAEVVFNPTLAHKLKKEFNIDIPEFDPDDENIPVSAVIEQLRRSVDRLQWQATDECVLSLFSFHKLVMFQDLEINEGKLIGHSIVRALGGEGLDKECIVADLPAEAELDKVIDPEKTFHLLDADSSQLACLAAASLGQSLVIQGPPGTGKSQTIANLIAESIGAGKTVLFVSEKMAALEVVYKRLKKAGLSDYCLELHSHKANKREVVQELKRCLESHPTLNSRSETNFPKLRSTRDRLNAYVRELHAPCGPLRLSPYRAVSRLSKFQSLPLISLEVDADALTQDGLLRLTELAGKLEYVWLTAVNAEVSVWRGFEAERFTTAFESAIRNQLSILHASIGKLSDEGASLCVTIGAQRVETLSEIDSLAALADHLAVRPVIHSNWLASSTLDSLRARVVEEQDRHCLFVETRKSLNRNYRDSILVNPEGLAHGIQSNMQRLTSLLQTDNREEIFRTPAQLCQFAEALKSFCSEISDQGRSLSSELGVELADPTPSRVVELAELTAICAHEEKPDEKWLDSATLQRIRKLHAVLAEKIALAGELSGKVLDRYRDSLFELDLDRLIGCYSSDYLGFGKWLNPQFYRDRNEIRRCHKTGELPIRVIDDLTTAKAFRDLRRELNEDAAARDLLGERYKGLATDLESIESEQKLANSALATMGEIESPRLRRLLSNSGTPSAALRATGDAVIRGIVRWKSEFEPVSGLVSFQKFIGKSATFMEIPIAKLEAWAAGLAESAKELVDLKTELVSSASVPELRSYDLVLKDLILAADVKRLQEAIADDRTKLDYLIGTLYRNLDTDWVAVLGGIDWVIGLKTILDDRPLPGVLLNNDPSVLKALPDGASLRAAAQDVLQKVEELSSRFEITQNGNEWHLAMIARQNLDLPSMSVGIMPLRAVRADIETLQSKLSELREWCDFIALRRQLEAEHLLEFSAKVISDSNNRGKVAAIMEKALLSGWLDSICSRSSVLTQFRAEEHSKMVAEFSQQDRISIESAPARLAELVNRRRPQSVLVVGDSEAATLMREANKKKRHMPLRVLFGKIPNSLTRIKPCLMMSPVAVSQYLPAQAGMFDLVVFDEASQICSEDAVGAIYRGKQVVVAGDDKQLPPTNFFKDSDLDDGEWSEDSDEGDVEYMSVLEQFAATGLPSKMLRWHYRSKDEGLIAFSNAQFYGDKLVTFPSSYQTHEGLGVKFIHVTDGIYDRGGRRDNRREAEKIADLVFEHFDKSPDKTLGVVAFSVAQMTAIEDTIELRRKTDDRFEAIFSEDRLEGFFVKNLENVQGDERDVMIFSVGYGRDIDGRVTGNFGPISRSGGGRRLNVAVTRAREKVLLVSSIRAADIDLATTKAPGALLLHKYLDYAERGRIALQTEVIGDGEADSPFEEDVASEIKALGYKVVPQVGCSGFRIDLGILSTSSPGAFLMGVECDGATYHSSHTARDRDRLRGEILRKRGWQLHRIWSTDWFYHRAREIKRLEAAIEAASSKPTNVVIPAPQSDPISVERTAIEVVYHENGVEISGTVPYVVADIRASRRHNLGNYTAPVAQDIISTVLLKVVALESPVHFDIAKRRVAHALHIKRIGSRFEAALRDLADTHHSWGRLHFFEEFLWKSGQQSPTARVPTDANPMSVRRPEHICAEEVAVAMELIIKQSLSIESESLIVATARLFRFERTGDVIQERFSMILKNLIDNKRVHCDGDRVSPLLPE